MATKKDITLLGAIVAAMANAAAPFYIATDAKPLAGLLKEGLIETNDNTDEVPGLKAGQIAVRATDAGSKLIADQTPGTDDDAGDNAGQTDGATGGTDGASAGTATGATGGGMIVGTGFDMGSVGTTRASSERYKFDDLAVGGYIFVPNTTAKPNAAKSLASTVSSAVKRYSKVIEGQTVVNRRGNTVPKTEVVRDFKVVPVKSGKVYGEFTAPADGACIVRVK